MLTIASFCSKNQRAINLSNSHKSLLWKEWYIRYVHLGGRGLFVRRSVAHVMRAVDFLRSENIAARNAKAAALRKAEADAAARKAADEAAAAQVKAADDAASAELFQSDAASLIEAWKVSELQPQHEEVSEPITCLFFARLILLTKSIAKSK